MQGFDNLAAKRRRGDALRMERRGSRRIDDEGLFDPLHAAQNWAASWEPAMVNIKRSRPTKLRKKRRRDG